MLVRHPRAGSHGLAFTLAEVLVFVGVVAVAVLALLSTQLYASRAMQFNRQRHTASTILYSELSRAQHDLDHNFSLATGHPRQDVPGYAGFQSAQQCLYADAREELRRVTVAVYWQDRDQPGELSAWTYGYHQRP